MQTKCINKIHINNTQFLVEAINLDRITILIMERDTINPQQTPIIMMPQIIIIPINMVVEKETITTIRMVAQVEAILKPTIQDIKAKKILRNSILINRISHHFPIRQNNNNISVIQ